MFDPAAFRNIPLLEGFVIAWVRFTDEGMEDAAGREAIATTAITETRIEIVICRGLDSRELSITLYHEILEAVTIASLAPPESVLEFVEADFERVAHEMHENLGDATPSKLIQMLRQFGFGEK